MKKAQDGGKPQSLQELVKQRRLAAKRKKEAEKAKAAAEADPAGGSHGEAKGEETDVWANEVVMVLQGKGADESLQDCEGKKIIDIGKLDNSKILNEFGMAAPLDNFCCIPDDVQDLLSKNLYQNLCLSSDTSLAAALETLK